MSEKQIVKFGDICCEVKHTTKDPITEGYERYIGLEHLESGSLKIKRWGMIAEDTPSFTRVFKKGHILFGKRRPYLRKAAIAEFDGICSGDIIVMDKKEGVVSGEFLPYVFMKDEFWEFAIKNSSGSLSPRTKFSALSLFDVEIPCNEDLSNYIELLRKMEELVGKAEDLKSSLDKLTNALILKEIFPIIDGDPFNIRVYRDANMPSDYMFYKLKDVAVIKAGATPARSKLDEYYTSESQGVPWVKTLDLNESTIHSTDEYVTSSAVDECNLHIHQPGTVLLAMYGGFNQIGRTSLLKTKATTNQAISAIKCNENIVLPEYCMLWLKVFRFLWKRYAASSRKDPNITKYDIESFPIWVPDLRRQQLVLSLYEDLMSMHEERMSIATLQKAISNL